MTGALSRLINYDAKNLYPAGVMLNRTLAMYFYPAERIIRAVKFLPLALILFIFIDRCQIPVSSQSFLLVDITNENIIVIHPE